MKQIPLTQGKFAIVDDSDYEWLMQWNWHLHQGYCRRNKQYDNLDLGCKYPLMHRLVLGDKLKHGMVCDHINRDKLDNRRENLRVCTRAENGQNRTKSKGTSSIYLGVSCVKGKWLALVTTGKIKHRIGIFTSEVDAALAYNRASISTNRLFANLNPVVDDGRVLTTTKHIMGVSKLRGVSLNKTRWQARLCTRMKQIYLGTFDTPEEAHAAYIQAKQNQ